MSSGVTMVISSLECGGAEKVLKNMSDYWVEHDRSVTVITLFSKELDFYQLDQRVKRIDLGLTNKNFSCFYALLNAIRVLWKLRKAIKISGNSVVISFIYRTNILTLLAACCLGKRVIVTEHTDPRQRNLGNLLRFIRKYLYRKAYKVIVLTRNVKEEWCDTFLPKDKSMVIPNVVVVNTVPVRDDIINELPEKYIVTMGRLIPEKGYDLLLRAFKKVVAEFPDMKLILVGDGPEKDRLLQISGKLMLKEKVIFMGSIRCPEVILENADCFVLTSLREGFSMVIVEAMYCGTVPVSFDCPSGPAEIISDGVDGILVPVGDVDKLAEEVISLLNNDDKRQKMSLNAVESAKRFSPGKIMKLWDEIISVGENI